MREELTLERIVEGVGELLGSWLPDATDLTVCEVDRVFGGNARRAWSARARWTGSNGAYDESMILLVRQSGSQVRTDPRCEVRYLSGLAEAGVRAPRVWAQDPDGHLFGEPSVLLARLPGSADAVAFLRADAVTGRARTLDLARAAAQLHAVVPAESSPSDEPVLEQWRRQFVASRLEPHPGLGAVFDWLADHQRPLERPVVVHGDFRVGNVLYDEARITGLLDWEMAHLGDPAEDLAWAYRALWSPRRFVSFAEFVAAYTEAGGASVDADSLLWHRVFSEAKFAAISLQGARAVLDGTSTNLRLLDRARTVIPAVNLALGWIASGASAPAGAVAPC